MLSHLTLGSVFRLQSFIRPSLIDQLHAPSFMQYAKASKGKKGKAIEADDDVGEGAPFDFSVTEKNMEGAISHFQKELVNIRSGRANPGLLEPITVESATGRRLQLKQIGTVSQRNASLLVVSVFDSIEVQSVVKAIRESPLKLQAKVESGEIHVPIPKPTTEMLQKMTKLVHQEAEHAKSAVRNSRHKALDSIKTMQSKDERFRFEKEVQKITDRWVAEIERIRALKEKDIKANQ